MNRCFSLFAILILFQVSVLCECNAQTTSKPYDLLRHKDVREELMLTGEQAQRLDESLESTRQSRRDLLDEWKPFFEDPSRQNEIRQAFTELAVRNEEAAREILLPFQVKRLDQLVYRKEMKKYGGDLASLLDNKQFVEMLNISPLQSESIKLKAETVRKKLLKEIEELVARAEKEIASELNPTQRKQYFELVGEPMKAFIGESRSRRISQLKNHEP